MQALIDYDGWRKWKDINKGTDKKDGGDEKSKSPISAKKAKGPAKSTAPSGTVKRDKRLSTGSVGMVVTSSGSGSEGMDVVASA